MTSFLYIFVTTVRVIIGALQLCMFLRAIFSWIMADSDGPLITFLETVTEPVILPVRALCDRFGWFEGMPFDMPFLITFILLSVVNLVL